MSLIFNSSTTSKRSIYPPETNNLWVVESFDSQLALSDGKTYDDWASGLGSNTLGYGRFKHFQFQPAASMPYQIEGEFAEYFCKSMETEAVRFLKSGSDALSCAVRLARAYTQRRYVMVFDRCYHGTGDSFRPIIWSQDGYPSMHETIKLPFGEELRSGLLDMTAAIVVEPAPKAIEEPPAGWLQHLREVCDRYGIILIADQVILGYRHRLLGYPGDASVSFDLSCYGKAMAQGAALSACTGRREIMELLRNRVHMSGTNNGSPLELHIARETLKEYLDKDICATLNAKGLRLKLMLNGIGFQTRGLNSRFEVCRPGGLPIPDTQKMDMVRFCFERGILFPGWASMAVSHTDAQMERLVDTLKEWREG